MSVLFVMLFVLIVFFYDVKVKAESVCEIRNLDALFYAHII